MKTKIKIDGMSCMHCVNNVQEKLNGIDGISSTIVSLEDKNAVVESGNPIDETLVSQIIADAGYKVVGIEAQ
jgi:Cu+-exporting ATPase